MPDATEASDETVPGGTASGEGVLGEGVFEATTASFASRHDVLAAGYGSRPDPSDPGDVLAMPMVLRLPKADPPSRTALLESAASATALLSFDPRVGVDAAGTPGPWRDAWIAWVDARIRKVARRARGARWTAAQDVPGVTAECAGAQTRALVPVRVRHLDPRIAKLQIGGTDLPLDAPGPPPRGVPVLWVDGSLAMSVGKSAAQVGHGVMVLAAAMSADRAQAWYEEGCPCAVRVADEATFAAAVAAVDAGRAVAVRDAGFTEVAPGSTTVVAVDVA